VKEKISLNHHTAPRMRALRKTYFMGAGVGKRLTIGGGIDAGDVCGVAGSAEVGELFLSGGGKSMWGWQDQTNWTGFPGETCELTGGRRRRRS